MTHVEAAWDGASITKLKVSSLFWAGLLSKFNRSNQVDFAVGPH